MLGDVFIFSSTLEASTLLLNLRVDVVKMFSLSFFYNISGLIFFFNTM